MSRSTLIRQILIVTGSFVNIITWDCLEGLKHLVRKIVPFGRPILCFEGQEKSPTGVIQLPLRFGDKSKARNLEVDFLVVDVSMTYNVILGRPTLYRVKAVIASYLLELRYEADDGSVMKL